MVILNSLRLQSFLPKEAEEEELKQTPQKEKPEIPVAAMLPDFPAFRMAEEETSVHSRHWRDMAATPSDFRQDRSERNQPVYETEQQTSRLLEKISTLLEQIAGSAEECSRKMDSDDENDLTYN